MDIMLRSALPLLKQSVNELNVDVLKKLRPYLMNEGWPWLQAICSAVDRQAWSSQAKMIVKWLTWLVNGARDFLATDWVTVLAYFEEIKSNLHNT